MSKRKIDAKLEVFDSNSIEAPQAKFRRIGHDDAASTTFDLTQLARHEERPINSHEDYQINFARFKSEIILILRRTQFAYLTNLLNTCKHYSAVYVYLLYIKTRNMVDIQSVDEIMHGWPMRLGLAYEQEHINRFNNNVMASQFETDLALFILQYSSKKIWRQVNQAIIDYIDQHYVHSCNRDVFALQLIQYKICSWFDFENISGRQKFVELLGRDSQVMAHVAEAATLHLIFFNYLHIYEPELAFDDPKDREEVVAARELKHRQMRPNKIGEMFSEITRGRKRVEYYGRTSEFGILANYDANDYLFNWHRFKFTPYKYRSKANRNSTIVQTFREHRVPFIAGPSGTCADCLEGLHFLIPGMDKHKKRQYVTLLAAAEVGLGHHSFHEVLLTALNDNLYPELLNGEVEKPVWQRLNYRKSYQALVGHAYQDDRAFYTFKLKYPQFLTNDLYAIVDEQKHCIDSVKHIQLLILNRIAYQSLNQGSLWHHSVHLRTLQINQVNLASFKQLSKKNLSLLINQLKPLSEHETAFIHSFLSQPVTLTHYTNALPKIIESGKVYSSMQLNQKKSKFNCSSLDDLGDLGNGGFVFFRFELQHDTSKTSRFGHYHLCLDGRDSRLLDSGWVSLYEMLSPEDISIVDKLVYEEESIRSFVDSHKYHENGCFTFQYGQQTTVFDKFATVFYGHQILPGIALSLLLELRRIGGPFQQHCLQALSLKGLNHTLSQLFRIEAKIPDRVFLSRQSIKMFNPTALQKAVTTSNQYQLEKLVSQGVDVFLPICMPDGGDLQDVFGLISQKDQLSERDIELYRFLLNHAKSTLDKAVFDKKVKGLLENERGETGQIELVNILKEFVSQPKRNQFFSTDLSDAKQSSDAVDKETHCFHFV